jgi:hypothetical protein
MVWFTVAFIRPSIICVKFYSLSQCPINGSKSSQGPIGRAYLLTSRGKGTRGLPRALHPSVPACLCGNDADRSGCVLNRTGNAIELLVIPIHACSLKMDPHNNSQLRWMECWRRGCIALVIKLLHSFVVLFSLFSLESRRPSSRFLKTGFANLG